MSRQSILFLDFDGVLNSRRWFEAESKRAHRKARGIAKRHTPLNAIDPAAVARLNAIVERTGCKIVVSSTWRILHDLPHLSSLLQQKGFVGELYGKTPNGAFVPPEWVDRPRHEWARGIEIAAWLEDHAEAGAFAIVDDSSDMAHLKHRLVRTPNETGLLDEHVDRIVALLGDAG